MKKGDFQENDIEVEDTNFGQEQLLANELSAPLEEDGQTKKIEVEQDTTPSAAKKSVHAENWFGKEGELAIDVYQTEGDIVIQSAIAGIKAEDLDIQIENDVVTIRGTRPNPVQEQEKEYFHEECFWGPFSRQVFLPEEIDVKNVEASMKEGVFTLRLPKMNREQTKKVKIAKK